jgi:uncharacterized membrane-anchored protein YhcB (DUF1043 family)
MRRYWRLLAAIAVVILAVVGIHNLREKKAQAKRDAAYQMTLRSYSATFKPGMTRKEVEDYFHANRIVFRQMCCVDYKSSKSVWDDLTKISQEDAPWFCSEKNIYIAFQFAGSRSDRAPGWDAEASDNLTAVSLYPWLEGCL